MSGAFAGLEDILLRGGIAPRHVKRYLRELSEHQADLIQSQRDAGFDEADAAARARAALGPDAELADAMLKQRDFRSISARFPWAVFGVMPPLALILGFLLCLFAMAGVGVASGVIVPDHRRPMQPVPAWFDWTASGMMFVASFLLVPLLGAALVWMAQRQRLNPLWPVLGMALCLLLGLHGSFEADNARISLGMGTMLPFYPVKGPFGPQGMIHWPSLLGQGALLCLPLAWLLRAWRKPVAPA